MKLRPSAQQEVSIHRLQSGLDLSRFSSRSPEGEVGGQPHGDTGVRKGHQCDDISFHYKKAPRANNEGGVSIPIGSKGQASSGLDQMFSKISFIYNQEHSLVNKTNKKCSFCFLRFP